MYWPQNIFVGMGKQASNRENPMIFLESKSNYGNRPRFFEKLIVGSDSGSKNLSAGTQLGIYLTALLFATFSCFGNNSFQKKPPVSIDMVIKTEKVAIGGTLVIPSHLKTRSLVIMSSGSGPQDRDETLEGFKIFKTIAEHLAANGIASFRYDDRGVGESTGDFVNSTLDDHAKDLESIIDYFKVSKSHTFKSFALLGHSQGGIVASKVAVANTSVKKVILMGAPAVQLIDVVLYQIREEHKQLGISPSLIEEDVSAHNRLMRAIKDQNNIETALEAFQNTSQAILWFQNSEKELDLKKIAEQVRVTAKEYHIIYGLPSLTSFLYYDPSKDFERLNTPVLSLFGGLDFQVPIHQNKDRMENALLSAGTSYQFKTFDKANHFFQKAETGNRDEYSKLEKRFVDGFLDEISSWLVDE
jgi:pimeloyl-ACP methyl ester carboxylesterase